MALKVWLPLTGDLHNQGCSNIEVTNNGATVNSAGKIGSCYYFDGTSTNYMTTTYSTAIGTNDFSIAMWIKIPTLTSGSYYAICTSKTNAAAGAGFGIYWNYTQKKFLWSTADGSAATEIWMANTVDTVVYDKWIHLVMVRNNNDSKKGYFYINGTRYELASVPVIRNITTDTKMNLGRCTNNSYFAKMYLNDFRIYDHALSIAEVREIAQGLVLHYKLNNCHSNNINLITNGYGDQGTLNWTSTSGVSTDVPSGHSEIKQSFTNNTTVDYIPINIQDQYQFEIYIKSTTSSGTTYPSFYPYDIDKNFIYNYQCKDGFNLATMTTITQTLNPGDTQIHVANLANWNANSGHYYNYAAIFKYKDSFGHLYADGEYTRNTPAFGTGTNAKTNLDKTNNIIILNSAYTGPQIAVGTSVCASAAAGASNYYPFNGIALTSITDWTYKSITFIPQEKNRLKYARYIKFYTYNNNLTAGIKLTNLTLTNGLIDSSGYNYNGTITGTLQVLSDTAHYNNSTYFNGSSYSKISSPTSEIQTISLWAKWSSIPSGQSIIYVDYKSKTGLGLMSTGILCSACGLSSYTFSKANIVANTWYHFVIVCPNGASSSIRKLYINGVEQTATSNTSNWSHFIDELQLGKRSTTSDGFMGEISDFRMYCTPLLDKDIKMLYNVGMKIDNSNALHAFEVNESGSRELMQGINITTFYCNHTYSCFSNYNNGELYFNANGSSAGSDYIPISPSGKTYYYDFEISVNTGNQFYIGIERYDANKTSRSNNACVYPVAIKPTSDLSHKRYYGTVNLSTDGVNPCAFIALRVLNGWSGTTSGVTGVATIHRLSLREVTTIQKPKLLKTGVFQIDELNEQQRASFYSNGIVETSELIEI